MNAKIRSFCLRCGGENGRHSPACNMSSEIGSAIGGRAGRPVMAERADSEPVHDPDFQTRFDQSIRRGWPQAHANSVLTGIIGDVKRQVEEITGVGSAMDQVSGQAQQQPVGGKLKGDSYYRVAVAEPMESGVAPYVAECADIIEALGMTFNEGEAFKALWRLAAARQGRIKHGTMSPQYDADKVAHYGARVAAQTAQEVKKGWKP